MPAEPAWSRGISNSTLCTWFYAFAVINGIGAGLGVVFALLYLFGVKNASMLLFVPLILPSVIAFFHFWFAFSICSRALKPEGYEDDEEEEETQVDDGSDGFRTY